MAALETVTPKMVQDRRRELELSTSDLAFLLDVHRTTIWRWESGNVAIPRTAWRAMKAIRKVKRGRTPKRPEHFWRDEPLPLIATLLEGLPDPQ